MLLKYSQIFYTIMNQLQTTISRSLNDRQYDRTFVIKPLCQYGIFIIIFRVLITSLKNETKDQQLTIIGSTMPKPRFNKQTIISAYALTNYFYNVRF